MTKEESFEVTDKDKVESDLPIITLNQKSKATIMDKVRWDSHAKLVIIDELTIPPKAVLYFKSVLHVPPPLLNATLKIRRNCGDVFSHCMWSGVGGGAGSVFSYESLFCACFKSHRCTFGLRVLSMIVVPMRCMTISTSLICTVDCLCNVLRF